ncbi:MAG: lysostaphin resistance A-like protein [Candidatus Limnocylindria bacterium]
MTEAPRYPTHPIRLVLWLGLVAIPVAFAYLGRDAVVPPDFIYRYSSALLILVQDGILLGLTFLLAAGRPARDWLGLRPPTSWKAAAKIGAAVMVVAWAVSAVVVSLSGIRAPEQEGLIPGFWDPSRAAAFAINFVLLTVFVALAEELWFRGLGYHLLMPFGRPVAIVAVGVAFALSHGLLVGLPVLAAMGMGLAYLRSRVDSVYPAILVHALFNAIALLAAVAASSVRI